MIPSAYNELKEERKKQRQAMEKVVFSIREIPVSPSSSHMPNVAKYDPKALFF